MVKSFFWIFISLVFLSAFSCSVQKSFQYQTESRVKTLLDTSFEYPDTRFVVLSDLHFYDKHLGADGAAFQNYLDTDRKLLLLTDEILDAAVDRISAEKPGFVLVSGDLTKDGEKACHLGVAAALSRLESFGIPVYVVPGNHDINNGDAVQYLGDETRPVPGINDREFKTVYHAFGYQEAISHDPQSLSYVAEPKEGLWIMGLDSNRWKENSPGQKPLTGGAFSRQTLEWIESQLILAKQKKKAVIVFMHHGVMAHYPANEKYYGQYVVDDSDRISNLLAAYGVRLVFTGHFHAQDITRKEVKDTKTFLFDIETGSLATAPCPYRSVQFTKGRTAVIQSRFIDAIPSHPENFADYAYEYVFNGTVTMANAALDKFFVSKEQQALISSQVSKAYCAHLLGDEKKPKIPLDKKDFGWWLSIVAWMQEDLINGWWTDLWPKDNQLTIDLATGDAF